MNRKFFRFSREQIVEAADSALDNWDFGADIQFGARVKANLEDILDGSDDIGSDPDYPAEHPTSNIFDWLQDYCTNQPSRADADLPNGYEREEREY